MTLTSVAERLAVELFQLMDCRDWDSNSLRGNALTDCGTTAAILECLHFIEMLDQKALEVFSDMYL